jgi:hypothetical protein
MLSLRAHAILSATLFALIILIAIIGNVLEGAGVAPPPPGLQLPAMIGFFALFLAFAFSLVPLMVKLFLAGQGGIGNAERGLIKALSAHQAGIVWAIWTIWLLGLAIALPAMIEDGFFGAEARRSFDALLIGGSQGTLTARPGMTVDELRRASTLKLKDPPRSDSPVPFAADAVFDFAVAGTGMVFERCRYYFTSTYTRDPRRIEAISIGISYQKMPRAALDAADEAVRARLAADGWLAGHEEYRSEESQRLHGGKTRGEEGWLWLKGETILHLGVKRMDEPVRGEVPATAGEWIQTLDLRERANYSGIERYVFEAPRK